VRPALHDPILVVVSLAVVLVLVAGARVAGARGVPPTYLRKALHAAIGLWTLLVTPRFHALAWALVPPAVFLGVNAAGKTRALVPGLAPANDAASARGLWTFPLGVAATYLFFWDVEGRAAVLAGCAVLAFADPLAALAGARFGQRRFHPLGHGRTLEGSLAFFIVAAAVVAWIAAERASGVVPWRLAVGCGVAGTVVEAISPPGWDNLSIPVAVAATYAWLA
jgi:dolichol kinase